jgi:hypothetical protein
MSHARTTGAASGGKLHAMNRLRLAAAASAATAPTASITPTGAGIVSTSTTSSQSLQALMLQLSQQRAAALDQQIKSQLAGGANTSQADMLKLQALVSKQNQTSEMISNLMQKFASTRDSIIANMR